VVVDIDEAWRNRQARRIDPARCRSGVEIADGRDAPVANPHVRADGGSTFSVQYRAPRDQNVVLLLRGRPCAAGQEED